MKNTQIEIIANEILNKTKPNTSIPLDIMYLAKQLDFVVGNAKLSDNDDGFILVDRNKRSVLGQDSNKVIGVKACLKNIIKQYSCYINHHIRIHKNRRTSSFSRQH